MLGIAGHRFHLRTLHADHERRLPTLAGRQDRLRAVKPLLFGKCSPAAGDLRPHKAMDAASIAKLYFRRQAIEVELVVLGEGRESDRKEPAQGLAARLGAECGI